MNDCDVFLLDYLSLRSQRERELTGCSGEERRQEERTEKEETEKRE